MLSLMLLLYRAATRFSRYTLATLPATPSCASQPDADTFQSHAASAAAAFVADCALSPPYFLTLPSRFVTPCRALRAEDAATLPRIRRCQER